VSSADGTLSLSQTTAAAVFFTSFVVFCLSLLWLESMLVHLTDRLRQLYLLW
jgi:hypothetical protein